MTSVLKISQRSQSMQSSPIRKLIPYAEKAKAKGIKVFHLNLGQPDIHSPQEAIKALQETKIEVIEYSHSAGNWSLRTALANYYQTNKINVSPEEILITTGGSEAILNVMCTCFDAGDEIIIPEPFYTNYNFFAQVLGVKVVPITCDIKNNFALPDIASFEKVITKKTKAILINTPGNPTGVLYSKSELEALKKIILKHHLYLISDEVYSEFCYDGNTFESAMHLKGVDENVILIDSFSKKYSLTGIRVGSVVTKNKSLLENFLKFSQGRISPPSLGQLLAEYALKFTNKNYLLNMRDEYQRRRDLVVAALRKMDDVFVAFPNSAFYCMAELPIDHCDNFCRWLLEDFHYQNATLMLAPANGFYANPKDGTRQVRIAYVLNENDLNAAMTCLSEALKIYPNRRM